MSGYIKLYRSARGTSIAQHPEYFAAWVHLLLMATHKERQQVVGTKIVTLKPGQLVFGRLKFSANTGISENKIRSALTVMKNLGMITSKAHAKFSVITITKWSDYQGESPANNQHPTSNQPASNHKQECIKNGKKSTKKTSVPSADGTKDYPEEFERAWKQYPKRTGGNPKRDAYSAWKARIESGVKPEELESATKRYAEFCKAGGKIGTEFVMQAKRFYGKSEHYREDWKSGIKPANDPLSDKVPDDVKEELFRNMGVRR